jgi:HAE1 family hydrophobic/amphiphilic exporter-1
MGELSGPVIGIALVLSAVFVPTAFIPGITGKLYQQFAVTIAISVLFSAFNALTLSPALGSLLLRPKEKETTGVLQRFFAWFNQKLGRGTEAYVRWSNLLLRKSALTIALLVLCGGLAGVFSKFVPSSFLPDEDQGYAYVNMQLPADASLERTTAAAREVEKIIMNTPGVQYTTSVIGFSLLSFVRTTYNATFFVTFKPWDERTSRAQQFQALKVRLNGQLARLPEAVVFAFSPPAIPGVGTAGGFTFNLEDRSGSEIGFLAKNLQTFLDAARKRPEIASLSTTFLGAVPQKYVQVDRDKVLKQGVVLTDVYHTVQAFMGGQFINYFNRFGRQWQVYIEAEAEDRARIENVGEFYVHNSQGGAVPLSTLMRITPQVGPEFTLRFNEYRSAQINGSAAPGYSAQQATDALEEVFRQTMPREMGFDYSGMSFQEQKAREGVPPAAIFGLSLLFVFLILAALYESWSLPFSVLLSTPVAVFGAMFVLWLRRVLDALFLPPFMVQIETDVYAQIGLVMLIGLAAKNAILIVEFAKDQAETGKPLAEAALEGARLRLRPILMTSFAFILGCVPLWTASGAGAVGRQIMGTTVIGGMAVSSTIGILFVPAIFYMVETWSRRTNESSPAKEGSSPPLAGAALGGDGGRQ